MTLEKEFEVCIKFELVEKKERFYQRVVMMGSIPKTYILEVTVIKKNYREENIYNIS